MDVGNSLADIFLNEIWLHKCELKLYVFFKSNLTVLGLDLVNYWIKRDSPR